MGFDASNAENPRAQIGDNGPPEDQAPPIDLEAALTVQRAADYLAFLCKTDAGKIIAKRGAKLHLVIRRCLAVALKGIVPSGELARILGLNRSTVEDDITFAEAWLDRNDELEADLGAMIEAVAKHVAIDPERLKVNLIEELEKDRLVKALEKAKRAEEKAAKEKGRAVAAGKAKAQSDHMDVFEGTLRDAGVADWAAIGARHRGAEGTARRLSKPALATLAALLTADRKTKLMERRLAKASLHANGISELMEKGLAKTLPPIKEDEGQARAGITTFGASVLQAASKIAPARKPSAPSLARV